MVLSVSTVPAVGAVDAPAAGGSTIDGAGEVIAGPVVSIDGTDRDGNGYLAAFDVVIEADTRIGGDIGTPGSPVIGVLLGGREVASSTELPENSHYVYGTRVSANEVDALGYERGPPSPSGRSTMIRWATTRSPRSSDRFESSPARSHSP
ncbi:hypothetical protein BRD17_09950 [Halobacteriales archaeon SW_7_68_16]|nr:MAG: hypothetical protein BRD17_09950 [Halobacteriales archaeon SW_7_68_16]